MNEIQKVFDQFVNRNIINIQFISFNKKQQKVERTFKLGQMNLV